MKIAIITDIPKLCENTMYLYEVKNRMKYFNVEVDIYLITKSKIFDFNGKLPLYCMLNSINILHKLKKYDLLHVQFSFPLGYYYTLFKKLHNIPILIHTHGYDVFTVKNIDYGIRRNKIVSILVKNTWKHCSGIIAVCNESKKEILKESIEDNKIHLLYNGIDENFFRKKYNYNNKLNIKEHNKNIIFLNVASYTPVKNHKSLLKGYSYFVHNTKDGKRSKLILCGSGSNVRARAFFSSIVNKYKIQKNVTFLNNIPHVYMPYVYNMADAFILNSYSEAHPWSILEAMSCELPVVAPSIGGIPETINDKNYLMTKLLVLDNSHEIFNKLIFLAENKEKFKLIGEKNRKIIMNKFTLNQHLRDLCSIYKVVSQTRNNGKFSNEIFKKMR